MQAFIIEDKYYTLSEVYQCIKDKQEISLSEIVKEKVQSSNQRLEDCVQFNNSSNPALNLETPVYCRKYGYTTCSDYY